MREDARSIPDKARARDEKSVPAGMTSAPDARARRGMRFECVALVSGGKDGVLAALDAASRADARVVCLANLSPGGGAADDVDSHCFQTVGHECVDGFAACAGVDVYRRRMRGSSRAIGMTYGRAVEGDEVEDLRATLRAVRRARPEVNAVCSGAILSDYQRLRVEAVCADLGLTSLAPLWRVPQREVLARCAAAGVDARLVKVAAMGLDPRKHLGASIADVTEDLIAAEDAYGSHCAGEGGEFETLVVDCPLFVRGRLELTSTRTVKTSEDRFAPSAHLVCDAYEVVLKTGAETVPAGRVIWVEDDVAPSRSPEVESPPRAEFVEAGTDCVAVKDASCLLRHATSFVEPYMSVSLTAVVERGASTTHETCAEAIFLYMRELVSKAVGAERASEAWTKVAMTHVYLDDMSMFARVNGVYSKYMPSTAPSARACVATCLPEGAKVQVDCMFVLADGPRKSLHVQSISSWAPACIGPYGQSISVNGLAYVAGQIGMEPTTLDLVPGIVPQLERAMRSAVAVADVTGAPLGARALAVTLYTNAKYASEYAAAGADSHPSRVMREALKRETDSSERHFSWKPLVMQLVVTDLPKGSIGEIAPVLLVGSGPGQSDDNDDDDDDEARLVSESHAGAAEVLSHVDNVSSSSVYRSGRFMHCAIAVKPNATDEIDGIMAHLAERLREANLASSRLVACRLHHLVGDDVTALAAAVERFASTSLRVITVPVLACGVDDDLGARFLLEARAESM